MEIGWRRILDLHRMEFKVWWVAFVVLLVGACRLPLSSDSRPLHPESHGPLMRDRILTALPLERRWIVSATEAQQLISQGATLLDTRQPGWLTPTLPEAIPVRWQQFSPKDPITRGTLLVDDVQLTRQLQALGISNHTPVIVIGNPPHDWGEDGRIVWMLRTLGHPQAVLVEGGYQAFNQVQQRVKPRQAQQPPQSGNFVVNRHHDWHIQRDQLKEKLNHKDLVIIDTREPREFTGATPYGERRGGHLPGAIHLYFKELITKKGTILSRQTIVRQLNAKGIQPDTPIVVYCTGGIRSGWLTAVLVTLGYSVKNYAGSTWEWSAATAEQFPLLKTR